MSYYSNKELRDVFTQICNADIVIQKMTIEGEKIQKSLRDIKIAGIGMVAVTGLALGAMGAANRAADRQSLWAMLVQHFGTKTFEVQKDISKVQKIQKNFGRDSYISYIYIELLT